MLEDWQTMPEWRFEKVNLLDGYNAPMGHLNGYYVFAPTAREALDKLEPAGRYYHWRLDTRRAPWTPAPKPKEDKA